MMTYKGWEISLDRATSSHKQYSGMFVHPELNADGKLVVASWFEIIKTNSAKGYATAESKLKKHIDKYFYGIDFCGNK